MKLFFFDGLSDYINKSSLERCICEPSRNVDKGCHNLFSAVTQTLCPLIICLLVVYAPIEVVAQSRQINLSQEIDIEQAGDIEQVAKKRYNFDIPIILAASGALATTFDNNFRNMRELNHNSFAYTYDDYTQYLPAAVMLSLKTFGVEGRSNTWGQMLLSDATSIAITLISVNALKYTICRTRPDSSAKNSFPSGHTATAFMTATMLHKEYGEKSPWYSVGAYTCASVTGISRWLNNRHWVGDIIAGAGIGIMSVELGYLLTDIILKKPRESSFFSPTNTRDRKPSFVAVQLGSKYILSDPILVNDTGLKIEDVSYVGVEGAWYPHKRFGVGGQIGMSTYKCSLETQVDQLLYGAYNINIGIYNSLPIASCLRVESKILLGRDFKQDSRYLDGEVDVSNDLNYLFGSSLSYWGKDNFQIKLYCDYIFYPHLFDNKPQRELSTGISFMYMFGKRY